MITLQLADHSIIYLREVIEDVLMKVGMFILIVDFVMLDVKEDQSIPLTLGRSFLKTVRTIIDVDEGKMILRAGDESNEFYLLNKIIYLSEVENCWAIKMVEEPAKATMRQNFSYSTIGQYVEKLQLKETENIELSRNNIFFQRLMIFETKKVDVSDIINNVNCKSKPLMKNDN